MFRKFLNDISLSVSDINDLCIFYDASITGNNETTSGVAYSFKKDLDSTTISRIESKITEMADKNNILFVRIPKKINN